MRKLTQHHRNPKSLGGTDEQSNISNVTEKKHRAWHVLFGTKTPDKIIWELNNVWMDPAYRAVLVEKQKPDPNQMKFWE